MAAHIPERTNLPDDHLEPDPFRWVPSTLTGDLTSTSELQSAIPDNEVLKDYLAAYSAFTTEAPALIITAIQNRRAMATGQNGSLAVVSADQINPIHVYAANGQREHIDDGVDGSKSALQVTMTYSGLHDMGIFSTYVYQNRMGNHVTDGISEETVAKLGMLARHNLTHQQWSAVWEQAAAIGRMSLVSTIPPRETEELGNAA